MTEPGGSERAAIQILTRAVELDSKKKFSESLTCYEQGIRLLLEAVKGDQFFYVLLFIAKRVFYIPSFSI